MANTDFTIENGVLIKYKGPGGDVVIPAGVTSIWDQAFWCCTGLTSVTIPDSVTSIGDEAFWCCTGLMSIVVEDGNSVYHAIGNCLIETESKTLVVGCNASVIPTDGSVTSIGNYAFYDCTGLTSVTIPDSVTSIGKKAFSWCKGLTSVTIPDSVTSIGKNAFSWCKGLTSVTIPDSVTSIGDKAFYDCTGLTSVTIPDSVQSIGGYTFSGCGKLCRVVIPGSSPELDKCFKIKSTVLSRFFRFPFPIKLLKAYNRLAGDHDANDDEAAITEFVRKNYQNLTKLAVKNESATVIREILNRFGDGVPDKVIDKMRALALKKPDLLAVIPEICDSGDLAVIPEICDSGDFKLKTTVGGYAIKKYIGTDASVTVPEKIDGIPVVAIGRAAFKNVATLTSVVLPGSVGTIGVSAFENCWNLRDVTIPRRYVEFNEQYWNSWLGWIDSPPFYQCAEDLVFHAPKCSTAEGYAGRRGINFKTLPDAVEDDQVYQTAGLSPELLDAAARRISENDVETLKAVCDADAKKNGGSFRTFVFFCFDKPKVVAETEWFALPNELKERFLSLKISGCFDDLIIDYELTNDARPPLLTRRAVGGWTTNKAKNRAKMKGTTLTECAPDGYTEWWMAPVYRATVPAKTKAIEEGAFASFDNHGEIEITWKGTVADWMKIDHREDLYRFRALVVCSDGTVQYYRIDHAKTPKPLYVGYSHFGAKSRVEAQSIGFENIWTYIFSSQRCKLDTGLYLGCYALAMYEEGEEEQEAEDRNSYDLLDVDNFRMIGEIDPENG